LVPLERSAIGGMISNIGIVHILAIQILEGEVVAQRFKRKRKRKKR